MRVVINSIVLTLLFVGCRTAPVPASGGSSPAKAATDPIAVVAEADLLAARDLWPGFNPRTIPVAIYDGERTVLFRHPAPPEGFEPVPGQPNVWVLPGRHPKVAANTSTDVGNFRTATLVPPTAAVSLRARAGVLIHEAFHVFQRARHPGWSANEVDLFTYPVDDPELLSLRRAETEALRRAMASMNVDQITCWARAALALRHERFAVLPAGSAAYERQTELNEGLASYVEQRATGQLRTAVLPVEEFAADAIRQRAYQTGAALARLLDAVNSSWRSILDQHDSTSLDVLLGSSLPTPAGPAPACALTSAERDRLREVAAIDIGALRARRAEQRREFLAQPGWRLVIAATRAPLFPQGFDPLNVQTVARGEVLHTRYLKLGNEAGEIEVLGRASLTEAAGEHPLFNGVKTLTLTGLARAPSITEANGVVTVQAEGLTARLHGAVATRADRTVTIRLPSAP